MTPHPRRTSGCGTIRGSSVGWDPRLGVLARPPTTSPIEAPAVRDAFELVLAGVFEDHARANDEVLHSPRDEDLPRPGQRSDACSDDDRETTHLCGHPFALSGMDAGPDLEPKLVDSLRERRRASDGRAGPSKVTKNPSPAVSTSRPRCRSSSRRTIA